MTPTYTIIIPHKDIPDLLQRCLDSIPVRDDIEVIVADDNSDSRKVDFSNFPKWKGKRYEYYLTKEGKGAGYARNVGLDHARGRWIIFADADDFFAVDFSDLLDDVADADEDIVFFDYLNVRSDDVTQLATERNRYKGFISDYLEGDPSETNLRIFFFVPWCKLVKRELIERHRLRFDEVKWNNDMFFCVKTGCLAKTIAVRQITAYVVTLREGSLTYDLCATDEELEVRVTESIKTEKWLKQQKINAGRSLRSSYLWVYYERVGFWRCTKFCLQRLSNWNVSKTMSVFLLKRIVKKLLPTSCNSRNS